MGQLPEPELRSGDRARVLPAPQPHDPPRRGARLRRGRHQRAPQHDLQHDPGLQRDGRVGCGQHLDGEDPRRRRADQPRLSEPRCRGVRNARRHVGRPDGVRLPTRHRHGVLGERGHINPVTSRARFKESLDIILKCWTEDGPFRYDGQFYNYRYLNPWPKPYQKPYPKGFVVGSGSIETVELAVEHGLGYSIVFVPIAHQLRAFERMRELAAKRDRTVAPDDLSS